MDTDFSFTPEEIEALYEASRQTQAALAGLPTFRHSELHIVPAFDMPVPMEPMRFNMPQQRRKNDPDVIDS